MHSGNTSLVVAATAVVAVALAWREMNKTSITIHVGSIAHWWLIVHADATADLFDVRNVRLGNGRVASLRKRVLWFSTPADHTMFTRMVDAFERTTLHYVVQIQNQTCITQFEAALLLRAARVYDTESPSYRLTDIYHMPKDLRGMCLHFLGELYLAKTSRVTARLALFYEAPYQHWIVYADRQCWQSKMDALRAEWTALCARRQCLTVPRDVSLRGTFALPVYLTPTQETWLECVDGDDTRLRVVSIALVDTTSLVDAYATYVNTVVLRDMHNVTRSDPVLLTEIPNEFLDECRVRRRKGSSVLMVENAAHAARASLWIARAFRMTVLIDDDQPRSSLEASIDAPTCLMTRNTAWLDEPVNTNVFVVLIPHDAPV